MGSCLSRKRHLKYETASVSDDKEDQTYTDKNSKTPEVNCIGNHSENHNSQAKEIKHDGISNCQQSSLQQDRAPEESLDDSVTVTVEKKYSQKNKKLQKYSEEMAQKILSCVNSDFRKRISMNENSEVR